MRVLRGFFVVAILAVALLLFVRSGFWSVRDIRVEGNRRLTAEEVVSLSGVAAGQNLFTVRKGEVRERLLMHPRVKEVQVRYRPPDAVVIEVVERQAVGVLPVDGALWEVDAEAVLLGTRLSWGAGDPPLLTGIGVPSETLLPGERLSRPEAAGLLAVAAKLPPEIRRVVREIHYDPKTGFTLHTDAGAKVYLGQAEALEEKLVLFWAVYQQQQQEGKAALLAYVDVSRPKAPTLKYRGEGE